MLDAQCQTDHDSLKMAEEQNEMKDITNFYQIDNLFRF